jgi:hypothetical protein
VWDSACSIRSCASAYPDDILILGMSEVFVSEGPSSLCASSKTRKDCAKTENSRCCSLDGLFWYVLTSSKGVEYIGMKRGDVDGVDLLDRR